MTYGTYEAGSGVIIDLDAFAQAFPESFGNAVRRGLSHKFSNEVASKITSLKDKFKKDNGDAEMDDDAVEAAFEAERTKMAEAILTGKLAITAPGAPRGSGLESIAFELAFKRAKATLEPKGFWPQENRKLGIKADEATVQFAGEAMTRDEIASVVLAKYKDELFEEAKAERAKRLEVAKAKKANGSAARVDKVEDSLDDLL